jgi:lipocalin-like protein
MSRNVDRVAALKPKRRNREKNMGQRAVLGFLLAISAIVCESAPQGNAQTKPQTDISGGAGQLVGTWRLISRVVMLEDGTVVQDPGLGKTPRGYLIYDSSGHMAAQLMRLDRPTTIDCGTSGPAPSDNSQSVNGYDAYFGTYTIDETSHTVTHHLEGALAAADVGKNLSREFRVSGDKLTIIVRTNSPQEKQIRTLTWERVR